MRLVRDIPLYRSPDSGIERLGWLPSELGFYAAAVDRVTEVVAKAIGHARQQIGVFPGVPGRHLVEYAADLPGNVEVPALAFSTHQVCLSCLALADHAID